MKKGLRFTRLTTAMVVFALICVIGSAAATTAEAAIGTAAETVALAVLFIGILTMSAVALFMRWSQKKGHTSKRPRGSVKALNAAIIVALAVVDAKHTRMINTGGIPTSPKMMSRTCRTDFNTR